MASGNWDHTAKGKEVVLYQHKGKPNIDGVLNVLLKQVQDLEEAVNGFSRYNDIKRQKGANLDRIGELVGQGREGMSDDDYKLAIVLRAFLNKSCGESEAVISVIRSLLAPGRIRFLETYPAKVQVVIDVTGAIPVGFRAGLQRIVLGGVKFSFSQSDSEADFGFEDENGFLDNGVDGFSEDGFDIWPDLAGGHFVEVI